MNLVVRFRTMYMSSKMIKGKLNSAGVKTVLGGIHSVSDKSHFYIKHRHALKVIELFSNERDFEIRVSRFNK